MRHILSSIALLALFCSWSALAGNGGVPTASPSQLASLILLDTVPESPQTHAHTSELSGRSAAEADRLMGMFYALSCKTKEAETYFALALRHDASFKRIIDTTRHSTKLYLADSSEQFRAEGQRMEVSAIDGKDWFLTNTVIWWLYRQRLSLANELYASAIRCNQHNSVALSGYNRTRLKLQALSRLGQFGWFQPE